MDDHILALNRDDHHVHAFLHARRDTQVHDIVVEVVPVVADELLQLVRELSVL